MRTAISIILIISTAILSAPAITTAAATAIADDTTKTQATTKSTAKANPMLKIQYASIPVEDQAKALEFYTKTLGFVKKADIPFGEFRWLTVVSAGALEGAELALEPNENPAVKTFQKAIYKQGIPATAFVVEDVTETYERLKELGVKFTMPPKKVGEETVAVFDDTCGNLIMIAQQEK